MLTAVLPSAPPPLFWAAPASEVRSPGADSGKSFLDHIYRYKLGHVCHNKAFLFCLPKRCSRSRLKKRRIRLSAPANKKVGSGFTLKDAAPGGFGSANTGFTYVLQVSTIEDCFQNIDLVIFYFVLNFYVLTFIGSFHILDVSEPLHKGK